MSSRSWQLRIQDILDSIADIQQRTTGLSFEEFATNSTLNKAVLYDYIIIGEASANVPGDIQSLAPQIPWREMQDMRNILAHEYFQVRLQIAWDTIHNDLLPLMPQLQALLEQDLE